MCGSIQESLIISELSTPQRLLNVHMKLIWKVLANPLKGVISTIVNENQVAYVSNRFISECGRLISDVLIP